MACRGNRLLLLPIVFMVTCALTVNAAVEHDPQNKRVLLSDAAHTLLLRLNYDCRCLLDQVKVGGREVVRDDTGICSGIKVGDEWFTTRSGISTPQVELSSNTVTVTGIRFGPTNLQVAETWSF